MAGRGLRMPPALASVAAAGLAPRAISFIAASGAVATRPPALAAARIPLAHWLAMRSHGTVPSVAPAILVKVGDDAGPFYAFKDPGALDLDGMSLLKALQHDEGFARRLAGVALDGCTVHVCASASDEEPSAYEAKTAVPLKGAKTLGALAASVVATLPDGAYYLFVRVRLPPASAQPVAGAAPRSDERERECRSPPAACIGRGTRPTFTTPAPMSHISCFCLPSTS